MSEINDLRERVALRPGEIATVTVDPYRGLGGFQHAAQGLVMYHPRFGWIRIVRVFDYHRAEIRKLTLWETLFARVTG